MSDSPVTLQESGPQPTGVWANIPWDGPTVYRWSLWNAQPRTADLILFMLSLGTLVPLAIYGLFWLLSFLSAPVSFWLCVVVCGIFLLVPFVCTILLFVGQPREKKEARAIIYYSTIVLLSGLLYLLAAPDSPLAASFTNGPGAGLGQWLLFFGDNIASVVLLDIPEVFELRVSDIKYNDWLSRVVTVAIRILITFGLIELLWELVRIHYRKHHIYGTVQEAYWHCIGHPDPVTLTISRDGTLSPLEPVSCGVLDFLKAYKQLARETEKEHQKELWKLPD